MNLVSKISYKKEAEILYKMYYTLEQLVDSTFTSNSAFKSGEVTVTIKGNYVKVQYADGTISEYTHIDQ